MIAEVVAPSLNQCKDPDSGKRHVRLNTPIPSLTLEKRISHEVFLSLVGRTIYKKSLELKNKTIADPWQIMLTRLLDVNPRNITQLFCLQQDVWECCGIRKSHVPENEPEDPSGGRRDKGTGSHLWDWERIDGCSDHNARSRCPLTTGEELQPATQIGFHHDRYWDS